MYNPCTGYLMRSLLCVVVWIGIVGAWGCANTSGRSDSDAECEPGEDDCDFVRDEQNGGSGGLSGSSGSGGSGAGGVGGRAGASGTGFAGTPSGGVGGSDPTAGRGGAEAGSGTLGCRFEGSFFLDGQTFSSDCNECLCARGQVICTQIECPPDDECQGACDAGSPQCPAGSCEHMGACYVHGTTGIPAGDECNSCTCVSGSLQCTLGFCERFDEPPCDGESCDIGGICYPLNETTEDGCCTCGPEGVACSDAAWCAGQNPVGTRCNVDGDCQPGLDCRGDLTGERRQCIRSCNNGCPAGTECVDGVPHYAGGTIDDICLRTCVISADCTAFGSECDMPSGVDRRYCF